jgi:hypothetical protein
MLLRGKATKLVMCMRTGVQGVKVREDTCAAESAWWPVTDGKYDRVELHRRQHGHGSIVYCPTSVFDLHRCCVPRSCGGSAGVAANPSVPPLGRTRGCAPALFVVLGLAGTV